VSIILNVLYFSVSAWLLMNLVFTDMVLFFEILLSHVLCPLTTLWINVLTLSCTVDCRLVWFSRFLKKLNYKEMSVSLKWHIVFRLTSISSLVRCFSKLKLFLNYTIFSDWLSWGKKEEKMHLFVGFIGRYLTRQRHDTRRCNRGQQLDKEQP